jgi:hypothetical protein
MDYKLLALSGLGVYVLLFVSGMIISLISTQLQCSKIDAATSATQGAVFAVSPTLMYCLAVALQVVRKPFVETFKSFGIPEDTALILGVGYLPMLVSWITMVQNIQKSEKAACQSTLREMTDFKAKMLAELAEKEKAKEANANLKVK